MNSFFNKAWEFIKIAWNTFFNNKNKVIRWINRITLLIIVSMIGISLLVIQPKKNKANLNFLSQYAFNDPNQNYFKSQYNKAVDDAKSLQHEKDPTSNEYLSKENNIILTKMAENPNTNVVSPGTFFVKQFLNLDHHKITDQEKEWFKTSVVLTAGETGYVYTNLLLKSFGINNINKYTVGFDMYSGNLYISPLISQNYPQLIPLIRERAEEIWHSSTLSKRLPHGLQINFEQD